MRSYLNSGSAFTPRCSAMGCENDADEKVGVDWYCSDCAEVLFRTTVPVIPLCRVPVAGTEPTQEEIEAAGRGGIK